MKCEHCQAARDAKRLRRLHKAQPFLLTILAGVLLLQGLLAVAALVTAERLRDVQRVAAEK